MCGIIGQFAFEEEARIDAARLSELNDLMLHRGPDSGGVFVDGPVALGMRRLAIVDLSGGDQPMTSADGRYTIVFNGEIYNHEEIRERLRHKNYPLHRRSDTEALLYAYIDAGADCLPWLNGMFAFAVWDAREKTLFVARDRMGVKPLYMAHDARRFFFASELTPLRQSGYFDLEIDLESVADYLTYWYVCDPKTIFKNVRQLPPGHYATVRQGGGIEVRSWWKTPCGPEKAIPYGEACEQLQALLDDAIRLRMKVDVPIGTFLSGGIDSGLVTALAAQHSAERMKCFGIGFKEKSYSELDLAEETARLYSVEFLPEIMGEITPGAIHEVIEAFDEPLGNASYVPTYFLSKAARRQVTVVLTGDGGDELFGGYPTYQAPYFRKIHGMIPGPLWRGIEAGIHRMPVSHSRISLDYRLKQFARGVTEPADRAHVAWREITTAERRAGLFADGVGERLAGYDPYGFSEAIFRESAGADLRNRLMYIDLHTYLPSDHLRKVDRMSMANSLEAREPFLDVRLIEFAASLPASYKTTFFQTKKILKDVARPWLPKSVVSGKKKGLTSPIASWIANELKEYVSDHLGGGGLVGELFRPAAVRRILDEHFARTHDHSRLIWGLLSLQVWSARPGRPVLPGAGGGIR